MKIPTTAIIATLFFSFFLFISCDFTNKPDSKSNEIKVNGKVVSESPDISNVTNTDPKKDDAFFTGSFKIDDVFRYQAIYSSQNYDTFYELYAKCNIDNQGYITSIDFKIINFKGPVNIGFANHGELKNELIHFKEEGVLGLNLVVKGLSNNFEETLKLKEKVHKNSFKQFNVFRTLLPIDVTGNGPSTKVYSNVFDYEFYYRSGIGVPQRRNLKPGQYDELNFELNAFIKERDLSLANMLGNSGKCYKAQNFAYN